MAHTGSGRANAVTKSIVSASGSAAASSSATFATSGSIQARARGVNALVTIRR